MQPNFKYNLGDLVMMELETEPGYMIGWVTARKVYSYYNNHTLVYTVQWSAWNETQLMNEQEMDDLRKVYNLKREMLAL